MMTKYHNESENELELEIEISGDGNNVDGHDGSKGRITAEISEQAARFILDYSSSDTGQELAGVLLGSYTTSEGFFQVRVEAAIEARHTDAARGSVTFTHRSWEYINQEKEINYPDLKIIGWFHTHPGFGIFLSEHDKFIQKNFFNLPWQLAYVIDPIAGEHGVFGLDEGRLMQVSFSSPCQPKRHSLAPAAAGAHVSEPAPLKANTTGSKQYGVSFLKIALIAGLIILNGFLFTSQQAALRETEKLKMSLEEKDRMLAVMEGDIEAAQTAYKKINLAYETANLEAEALLDELSEEKVLREKVLDDYNTLKGKELLIGHKISTGDTLANLSERYLGSAARYWELAELNNLNDPNQIITGEILWIPYKHDAGE